MIGPTCLIVEWKSGPGAPDAPENVQLHSLLGLAAISHETKWNGKRPRRYIGAVVKPGDETEPYVSLIEFSRQDALAAAAKANAAAVLALAPDAPLTAGWIQCAWCRARQICPAYSDMIQRWQGSIVRGQPWGVGRITPDQWTPDDWGKFLQAAEVVWDWIDEMRQRARTMLENDPASISGWRLAWHKRRYVTEPAKVIARLKSYGLTSDQILAAANLPAPKIEAVLRQMGLKGRELQKTMEDVLQGAARETMVAVLTRSHEQRIADEQSTAIDNAKQAHLHEPALPPPMAGAPR